MKRLSKDEYIRRQSFDVNKEGLYKAGQQARDQGISVRGCPDLVKYVGETRATFLESTWMKGWNDRDKELRNPWLPYADKEQS
jgi:hypothetical protein